MNKSITYLFALCIISFAFACAGKKEAETTESEEWPEMDEFHMVMAESFHPYKDSSNLGPAKAYAVEMAKVAEKWANAPLPEKVNTDETKAHLAKLKDDARAFVQIAETGDSTKIGESLTSMHDLFHKLQETWYGSGKEHGHEHH